MGVQQVVRVEDKVAVVALLGILLPNVLQQESQGIALAHLHLVLPLKHPRSMLSGNGGCAVGAVVRHHINVQQVLGIVLLPDALQQLGDDGALVAGGDEHRVPAQFARREGPPLAQQPRAQKHRLIAVACREQSRQKKIDCR